MVMFVYFFSMSFATDSGDRLTNAMALFKVTTSPTFILSSPELAYVSFAFLARAGVYPFRAFEEAAALRSVMVQTAVLGISCPGGCQPVASRVHQQ